MAETSRETRLTIVCMYMYVWAVRPSSLSLTVVARAEAVSQRPSPIVEIETGGQEHLGGDQVQIAGRRKQSWNLQHWFVLVGCFALGSRRTQLTRGLYSIWPPRHGLPMGGREMGPCCSPRVWRPTGRRDSHTAEAAL